jgi:hypothetical protein
MTREFMIYLAGSGWGMFCGFLGCLAARWSDKREIAALCGRIEDLTADKDTWHKIADDRRTGRRAAA